LIYKSKKKKRRRYLEAYIEAKNNDYALAFIIYTNMSSKKLNLIICG
jgi:hypothetical protein